jgi:hypothetical protein
LKEKNTNTRFTGLFITIPITIQAKVRWQKDTRLCLADNAGADCPLAVRDGQTNAGV